MSACDMETAVVNEVFETFVALASACGILPQYGNDDNAARQNLILSLLEFTNLIKTSLEGNQRPHFNERVSWDHPNPPSAELLLAIENAATKLHELTAGFFQSQREKMDEISAFCDELQTSCGNGREFQRLLLQSRSMKVAFRKKAFMEKKAIENVMAKLHDLYMEETKNNESGALSTLCLSAAKLLGKQEAQNTTEFQSILSLVDEWQCSNQRKRKGGKDEEPQFVWELPEKTQKDLKTEVHSASKIFNHLKKIEWLNSFPIPSSKRSPGIYKMLLVGKERAGKSFICDEIEGSATGNFSVHRLNVYSRTIGELEDSVICFFNKAYCDNKPCILLLDNVDEVIGAEDGAKSAATIGLVDAIECHSSARALSTFLTMIDIVVSVQTPTPFWPDCALICTSKVNLQSSLTRFDGVFVLELPSSEQRKRDLKSLVGIDETNSENLSDQTRKNVEQIIDEVSNSTVGLSYAEISQIFRKAIMMIGTASYSTNERENKVFASSISDIDAILYAVKDSLQAFAPASLRSGEIDGFVDMRVLSSIDLLESSFGNPRKCPLYGSSADLAWKELESQIVIPLCRSRELNLLLCSEEHASVQGDLRGGVLLAGAAGTGKSLLARQCAAFAASLLPSIKLLDVSCTSMIHKEVGASEKAIHHLFECARSAAPCVVILDDVAIISSLRGHDNTTEGTMDRVLSTLLVELDGVERDMPFSDDSTGIAVIGITQNIEWVDPALLRPGRLGKIVMLNKPDKEARRHVAFRELEKAFGNFEEEVSELAAEIADRSKGMSGASVVALCNDARRSCVLQTGITTESNIPNELEQISLMRDFIVKTLDIK